MDNFTDFNDFLVRFEKHCMIMDATKYIKNMENTIGIDKDAWVMHVIGETEFFSAVGSNGNNYCLYLGNKPEFLPYYKLIDTKEGTLPFFLYESFVPNEKEIQECKDYFEKRMNKE